MALKHCSFYALLTFLLPNIAVAHSITCYEIDKEPYSQKNANGDLVSIAPERTIAEKYKLIEPNDPSEFVVYGKFSRINNLPFIHVREHEERWKRWGNKSQNKKPEISGIIEYTYRDQVSFKGIRIMNGIEEPFETVKTVISFEIWGEWIHGKVPEQGINLIGKMKQEAINRPEFRINTSVCPEYFEVSSEELLNKLKTCALKGAC